MSKEGALLQGAAEPDLGDYRSISALAIVAFLLGVLSSLSLAHPVLWSVPWLTVFVAWIAIRRIRRQPTVLSGRALAVCGLSLGLLFGSWAPAAAITGRAIMARQARQFAERWLQLVRDGDLQEAHRWMLSHLQRPDEDMPTKEFYEENLDLQQNLEQEFSKEPASLLVNRAQLGDLQYVNTETISGDEDDRFIAQRFRVLYPNGEHDSLDFVTVVRRRIVEPDAPVWWEVFRIQAPEP